MDLPNHLLNQIKEGKVVLFLGAGASFGAHHPTGKKLPLGRDLSNLLATKFLSDDYLDKELQYVSELAISESDLISVQGFIAEYFDKFTPAGFHEIICKIPWRAIFTVNYDLIIERVYVSKNEPLQDLVVFKRNGERVDEKLASPQSLMYTKLHGCITDINDKETPLILTPEQYVTHKKNRDRLFARIKDLSFEYPFVFIGYSFADQNIRSALNHLNELGSARPRSYMVGPFITDEEARLWEGKRVTSIKASFEDFLIHLDNEIHPQLRKLFKLKKDPIDHPFFAKMAVDSSKNPPSQRFMDFLESEVYFVNPNFSDTKVDPAQFYKGYFEGWDPIINHYDVEREAQDSLISEVLLLEEDERPFPQDFYLIKGHAGSGKTVLLRRIAWEAGANFEKLVVFVRPEAPLSFEPISEAFNLCKERVFLFVDKVGDYVDDVNYILKKSKSEKIPITIVAAERTNVWNIDCKELEGAVTRDYSLQYLNDSEISDLITLLEKHNSLGYLRDKPQEERVKSLSERAGRELLVALHEATLGKPFADIIKDEYFSIKDEDARRLYLTICILHRLGAYTRAGLISRVHEIGFTDFENRLFKPLEFIVFTNRNYRINDFVYLSRHQHIAEIVFEEVLVDVQDRYDEYVRIISFLDVDYENDRHAFLAMTSARNLMKIFKDPGKIRSIFRIAKESVADEPSLFQQEAIFEMSSDHGSFEKAETLLKVAMKLSSGHDRRITHSMAELNLKRARVASHHLKKKKYLEEAEKIARKLVKAVKKAYSHPYHTLIKVLLLKLEFQIEQGKASIDATIKDVQRWISEARQLFPDDSFILDSESKLNTILNNVPEALSALENAFHTNKRSPYIAQRLARFYLKSGRSSDAKKTLEDSLNENPNEKEINFHYAKLLMRDKDPDYFNIKHYLRKSFTKGDSRHEAHFWYARALYILGEIKESETMFKNLAASNHNKREKGVIKNNGKSKEFVGTIIKLEASFGFLKRDVTNDRIFIGSKSNHKTNWRNFRPNQRITFNICFNYFGPVAINAEPE